MPDPAIPAALAGKPFDACRVGDSASWTHRLTEEDVRRFAELSGDYNPVHLDDSYARQHGFRSRIVYGMLAGGAYLSRVLGMLLPGPGALWLTQDTRFARPIYLGDEITITVRVTQKNDALRTLVLETAATNQRGERVQSGEAKVMMLMNEKTLPWDEMTAVVTGGSRGIGAAICAALGERGARVVVNYHQQAAAAAEVVAAVEQLGGRAVAVQADITAAADCARLVEAARAAFGPVNVLVHNATPPVIEKALLDLTEEDFDGYYRAYVQGAFNLARQVVPEMKAAGCGRIVHVLASAVLGNPPPGLAAYVAAKSGLLGLSRAMAVELAPFGITVNSVSPSVVPTDRWRDVPDTRLRAMVRGIPLQRFATPQDVARAVLICLGPEGSYMTGVNLPIAGGEVM